MTRTTRTTLTRHDLTTAGTPDGPVDDGAFALPDGADPPAHMFEGVLELDHHALTTGFAFVGGDRIHPGAECLPPFRVEFVQVDGHLVPVQQGLVYTGSPYWNLIIGPGRAWSGAADDGMSRAAFPFTLVQFNQNCTHNGVMTFLFDDASVSLVRYQITQETCDKQFDQWGQVAGTYRPGAVSNASAIKSAHQAELAGRIPTRPLAALATDFPDAGIDIANIPRGITPEMMTAHGIYFRGVNYVAPSVTRHGEYPFPDEMRLASYSTAKSAFGGVVLLRLAQVYGPGVYHELIADYLPEHAAGPGDWRDVQLSDAANMATGHYVSPEYMIDEPIDESLPFLVDVSRADKLAAAFAMPRGEAPGQRWVYQTTATFLLVQAIEAYLRRHRGPAADVFDFLRDDVFEPIGLSQGALTSCRTDNAPSGTSWGGYGLFWIRDDVAKLGRFLNEWGGRIGERQVLEPRRLAVALQRDASDPGLDVLDGAYRYHSCFWALPMTPGAFPGLAAPIRVPFMSGFGGCTVAMMPNGATYYYFSDGYEFIWTGAVMEMNKIERHVQRTSL